MLRPNAIYLADNGRLVCQDCAGATARFSGLTRTGERLIRLTVTAVGILARGTARAVHCECRKVTLTGAPGPDGWPAPAEVK